MRIVVIINATGGSFVEGETEQIVRSEFEARGIESKIWLAKTGSQIESLVKAAVESNAEVIVGGGGDGTLGTVASFVAKTGKSFGILPLGTLNHFSKDLGIPQDLGEAIGVIAENHTKEIDLGEVNGRIFVNNSSIGLYPRIVRHRQVQQNRLGRGKWSAAFIAALRIFWINPFFSVRIGIGDRGFQRKTPFLFVGNNEYEMELYNIGTRPRLDEGKLSIYLLHHGGRWGAVRLLIQTVFGQLRQSREFDSIKAEEVTIATRKKLTLVALDGEVSVMQTPLRYRILPAALKVIIPQNNA